MSLRVAIGASSFAAEDAAPRRALEEKGIEIVFNETKRRLNEEETIALLKDVDGLIAGLEPLNRRVLASAAPRLKALARVGIGMTNVDQEAAKELGVKVSNTPEGPTQAVAELTVGAILSLCRGLVWANAEMHAGRWPKKVGFGLDGAKVLLVGYGRIGRRTGDLLRAFGAKLWVFDPYLAKESLTAGERLVALDEGLAGADIVSLHAAGEDILLGPGEITKMRKGAFLFNSARGGLVDEQALGEALESGHLAGAWFDAFWQEPYKGPLAKYDNFLMTPHMGTYSAQCRLSMESTAVANLLRDMGLL